MDKKKNVLIVASNYYQEIFENLVNETKEEVEKHNLFCHLETVTGVFEGNWDKKKHDNTENQEFREYGVGAQILRDIGVRKMVLLTNSKKAIIGLQGFDLKIVGHKELRNE